MLATYGSSAVVLAASCAVGQALFAICGRRSWSWLSPTVGLAVLTAVSWGTIRLPGDGAASAVAIVVLGVVALAFVIGRVARSGGGVAVGVGLGAGVVLAASLPFLVEGRYGILGTGLNPDMSQHLFAADALAHGDGGRLLDQGYPLGPQSLVVGVSKLTGAGLVQAFDGLILAICVCAALAALAVLERLPRWRAMACAAFVALPYIVASYLIQGAFKETMEALFVLAFAVAMHQAGRRRLVGDGPRRARALEAVPLAALAVGSVYAYSFPGVLWLVGAAGLWALIELGLASARSPGGAGALVHRAAPPAAIAIALVCIASAPEIGRMLDFASFETFDPSGPGLGNLFNPISPLEALGIWPSGDFRLDPGDGAMPAAGFYLGELLGLAALAYGLAWWLRRGERAVPAALAAALVLYAYAHFAGTPYQAAKSIAIAGPLAMLISARALLSGEPVIAIGALRGAVARRRGGVAGAWVRWEPWARRALAIAFLGAAGASSLVALANGPVGPANYSPELTGLRSRLGAGSTLVLVPERMLADEHGRDYVVWELRGGRVCVAPERAPSPSRPPAGVSHVITFEDARPYANLSLERRAGPYVLWEARPLPRGRGSCPLISVGGRADPAGD